MQRTLNSICWLAGSCTSMRHVSPSDQDISGAASTSQSPRLGWPPTILWNSP